MTKQEAIRKADIIQECMDLLREHQELMQDLLDQVMQSELNLQSAGDRIDELTGRICDLQELVEEYQQSERDYLTLLNETEPLLTELEILLNENSKLREALEELRQ